MHREVGGGGQHAAVDVMFEDGCAALTKPLAGVSALSALATASDQGMSEEDLAAIDVCRLWRSRS